MKLTKSLKAKWVKALRSGEYQQGTGGLRDGNGYCCLGVLREVANLSGYDDDTDAILRNHCDLIPEKIQRHLADLNDGCGEFYGKQKSFKWIASYIERYL